jgi:hypothetical protein
MPLAFAHFVGTTTELNLIVLNADAQKQVSKDEILKSFPKE